MAPPSSDTPSTVAPSFLNRCPYSGPLGPPRRAEASEFFRERQRATLTFARGCCRSLAGGCSGVVCSGGCGVSAAAETQISYQAGDCCRAAWFLGTVAVVIRRHIPQNSTRLAWSSLLGGTASPHIQPSICLYGSTGEEGGPSAHGGDLTQPSLDALGRYIIGSLLLFQCL